MRIILNLSLKIGREVFVGRIFVFLICIIKNVIVYYYYELNAPTTRKSGTKIALDYAIKQNNEIIRFSKGNID